MKKRKTTLASILLAVVILLTGTVAAVAPAGAAAGGTGPDNALAPTGDWQPVQAGEEHWYEFYYAGDGSQIEIRMQVEPHESATFEVWTPEAIERWGLGLEADPIGRGSPDPFADGVLTWTGNFTTPGTYYAVVEREGSQPGTSYYLLEVSGDGVSSAPPAPTATAEAKPAKARPAVPSKPTGKVVFQTHVGGGIYIINVDGSQLQRVTTGMDPSWSPNGQ